MMFVLGLLLQLAAPAAAPQCGACHLKQTAAFSESQMTRAMRPASESGFLKDHPDLTFGSGKYLWSLRTKDGITTYTVSDGQQVLSAPVKWAFGAGVVAQTYVAERAGNLYELPISFYPSIAQAGWTLGHDALPHSTMEEAFGRKIDSEEARRCFGCHSTYTEPPVPGVQCGRCHDRSEEHRVSVSKGGASKMQKLAGLDAEQIGEICGRCHPTWAETAAKGPHNVLNVRFQLYRLTNSRCYDSADRRISCTGCHNPHEPMATDLSYYDGKCLQCHAAAGNAGARAAKICRVSSTGCVGCHMPKIEIAGLHYSFTDHQIRIPAPDGKYPE